MEQLRFDARALDSVRPGCAAARAGSGEHTFRAVRELLQGRTCYVIGAPGGHLRAVVSLRVNGAMHEVDIDPSTPLLYVLRNDLGLKGPRFGCGLSQCGACTVIIDGAAMRSCIVPASQASGEITTLEGLSSDGTLDPLQQAWIDEQVPQCGYCQNGQIMTARALLDRNPNPTDAEIRQGMEGALCRCMTYYRIQAAIKRAVRGAEADE